VRSQSLRAPQRERMHASVLTQIGMYRLHKIWLCNTPR
jgi:hypothetical protein